MDTSELLERVQNELKNVDQLCVPSSTKSQELNGLLKDMFDYSASAAKRSFGDFDTLLVEGMDAESIWEQLRSRNGPLTKFIKRKTTSLIKVISAHETLSKEHASFPEGEQGVDSEEFEFLEKEEDYYEEEGKDEEEEEEEEEEGGARGEELDEGVEEDDYEEGDEDMNEEYGDDDGADDDENYDSDGMEQWLDAQEEADEKHRNKMIHLEQLMAHKGAVEEGDSDADEDDEMLAARIMYEDDGDDGKAASAKFKDFFGDEKKGKDKSAASKKKVSLRDDDSDDDEGDFGGGFSDEEEENTEDEESEESEGDEDFSEDKKDEDEDENDNEENPMDSSKLTAYQKQKRKLAEDIKTIEAELMGKKSWELHGEIASKDRPENSLLEISTEIERASKPAPVITAEHTSSIEDMIIKRITDARFDDVQVPDLTTNPSKVDDEGFVLSQERSRVGLGEIYADDFLAKTGEGDAPGSAPKKDTEAIVEMKALFHKVCRSLDALAHFHYTPRPVVSEASVSTQRLASISMEDITPMAEGAYEAFAPEEEHKKKRGRDAMLMADAELTSDDRKRLRQASKAIRRKERKETGYAEGVLAAQGKGSAKYESKKTDDILRQDKRVVVGRDSDQNQYAKSGQFFERLQSQAQAEIAAGGKLSKKKKEAAPTASSSRVKM